MQCHLTLSKKREGWKKSGAHAVDEVLVVSEERRAYERREAVRGIITTCPLGNKGVWFRHSMILLAGGKRKTVKKILTVDLTVHRRRNRENGKEPF